MNLLPRVCSLTLSVLALAISGCESGAGSDGGTFVQWPMGYMPPLEVQDEGVPIEIGPSPVPTRIGGTPVIVMRIESRPPVEMIIDEGTLLPTQISAHPNERLTLRLTNQGTSEHALVIDLPDARVEMPSVLRPGDARILELTAPGAPGRYVYYCPIDNHRAAGEQGELIVIQPPTATQP